MNLRLVNIKQVGCGPPVEKKGLRGKALDQFPLIEHAFLTLRDGKIEEFGPMSACPQDETPTQDLTGRCVLPAFVDSHSHLVYAGTREEEFNLRLKGASYEEIAAAGGGILNSAAKVSASSVDQLVSQAKFRLENLTLCGTGTLE